MSCGTWLAMRNSAAKGRASKLDSTPGGVPSLRPLAVDFFHQLELLFRELRQAPDEQDELPVVLVFAAPAGHAGEADAVLDDGKELAIGELLRFSLSHVRGGRVHILTHLGFSAAVIGVTDRAMIGEVVPAFGDIERSWTERIFHLLGGSGSRQRARLPG